MRLAHVRLSEVGSLEARQYEAGSLKTRHREASSLKARHVEAGSWKTRHQAADFPMGVSPWRLAKHSEYDSPWPWHLRQLSEGESPISTSSCASGQDRGCHHVIIEGDPKSVTSEDQDLETASFSSSIETEGDREVLSHQGPIVRSCHIYPCSSSYQCNLRLSGQASLLVSA